MWPGVTVSCLMTKLSFLKWCCRPNALLDFKGPSEICWNCFHIPFLFLPNSHVVWMVLYHLFQEDQHHKAILPILYQHSTSYSWLHLYCLIPSVFKYVILSLDEPQVALCVWRSQSAQASATSQLLNASRRLIGTLRQPVVLLSRGTFSKRGLTSCFSLLDLVKVGHLSSDLHLCSC